MNGLATSLLTSAQAFLESRLPPLFLSLFIQSSIYHPFHEPFCKLEQIQPFVFPFLRHQSWFRALFRCYFIGPLELFKKHDC
jgi:hypothetical protein